MQKAKSDLDLHVFVCTNKKNGKECCADKGGEELRAKLKEWTKENPEWRKRIRVNSSGCLDRCAEGIAVAVYPDGEWWTKVSVGDFDSLKNRIKTLMDERQK